MFSLNDYFNQVFVINLDKDKERLESVRKEFEKINTRFERHPGAIPTEMDRRLYASRICQQTCSQSMIGIYMAHRQIWDYIVSEELPSAIIFEDDVRFTPNIADILPRAIQELPKDWDILYLGCVTCHKPSFAYSIVNGRGWRGFQEHSEHLVIPPITIGAHAYALSLNGAKKLQALLPKVNNHVDNMISMQLDHLNYYAVTPIVAYQDNEQLTKSNNINNVPVLPNSILSRIPIQPSNPYDRIPVSYVLSVPIITIPNTNLVVHVWAVLVALFAIFVEDAWKYISIFLVIDMMYAILAGKITSLKPYASMWILLVLGTLLRVTAQNI